MTCGCVQTHQKHGYHEYALPPAHRNSRMAHIHVSTTRWAWVLQNRLVAKYVAMLIARPLLTKSCTAGVLSFFQEVIANHIAGVPFRTEKDASFIAKLSAALKVDSRAFKMALYGFFISAPMGHYLNTAMLRIFAGRTSKKSKVARFCAQNFVVAPLQTFVFLISMAFIGGAKNRSEAMSKVHLGFGKMLGLTWVVQPAASWVAGRWVPIELWPPYYNLVYFTLGMYFKTQIKISQVRVMKTIKKEKAKAARRGSTSSSSSSSSSSSDSDKEKHD